MTDSRTSLSTQLDDALEHTPRLPRDAVTVALAYRYAAALDDCFDALTDDVTTEDPAEHARKVLEIARLGLRLEATLDRLGMSPSARPVVPSEGGGRDGTSPASAALDQLRRDAAAGVPASGIDYAASVDAAVTAADAED